MENKIYDLKKRSYAYALTVIAFLENLPKGYITETIGRQLLRSATSVGANIAEAQSSSSRKDFINFYGYALKSSNESKFVTVQLLEATDELSLRATEGSEAIPEIASSLPLLAMTRLLPEAELLRKFWLNLLKDSGKDFMGKVDMILNETKELSNILASSILTMRKKK